VWFLIVSSRAVVKFCNTEGDWLVISPALLSELCCHLRVRNLHLVLGPFLAYFTQVPIYRRPADFACPVSKHVQVCLQIAKSGRCKKLNTASIYTSTPVVRPLFLATAPFFNFFFCFSKCRLPLQALERPPPIGQQLRKSKAPLSDALCNSTWSPICCFSLVLNASFPADCLRAPDVRPKLLRDRLWSREPAAAENSTPLHCTRTLPTGSES
jgi:hypothetical protein